MSQYGEDLIEWLLPRKKGKNKGEKILDVGCGTGDLSKKITDLGAKVVGIDSSQAMVVCAKKKYTDIDFQNKDILVSSFQCEFDSVFSNATMHWIKAPDRAIDAIWNALKSNGRFVAEFGGENNIATIVAAINKALDRFSFAENKNKNPWLFLSVAQYATLLEKRGFAIRKVLFFDRFTPLKGKGRGLREWITVFAPFFFEGVPQKIYEEMLTFIEDEARECLFKNGKWHADYTRLRIEAEKCT